MWGYCIENGWFWISAGAAAFLLFFLVARPVEAARCAGATTFDPSGGIEVFEDEYRRWCPGSRWRVQWVSGLMAVIEEAEGAARAAIADTGTVRTARPREQESISTEGQCERDAIRQWLVWLTAVRCRWC